MTATPDPFDDLVITYAPEATTEAKECFRKELAEAVLAIAHHLVALEDAKTDESGLGTIEF